MKLYLSWKINMSVIISMPCFFLWFSGCLFSILGDRFLEGSPGTPYADTGLGPSFTKRTTILSHNFEKSRIPEIMASISLWNWQETQQKCCQGNCRISKRYLVFRTVVRLRDSWDSWWRHQMETFPRCWPFVCGIYRSPVNSPHKDQWREALMFSLIWSE